VVVFGEDHSFPLPGWARALIRRHEGPWAAARPEVGNGKPLLARSCAMFYMTFGIAAAPLTEGATSLVWHNGSYKGDALLAFGSRWRGQVQNFL
jgi:hypothetical protein